MYEDRVIQEVRAAREAYAASFNYDLRAMAADLRAQDAKGDRVVVRLEPRRPIEKTDHQHKPERK